MKNKILLLIILLFPAFSFSQEIVTGLSTNALLKGHAKAHSHKTASNMLRLPFFDDFSETNIYPNDSLWADSNVFINSAYEFSPVTVGVATFDALNDTGALYQNADAYGFTADTLTSKPIRLDSVFQSGSWAPLKKSDSVYFSFYYQPQGTGNAPETDDSLVLEFYSPKTATWSSVWSSEGMTLAQFHSRYNVWFKQVMIPISDSTSYFHKGFQFRFYNWASLANNSMPSWAGNVDQWNIDYVYLNKNRNMADSVYKDIAFAAPATSVLKNYYSMPWSQFNVDPAAELKDSLLTEIFNLDTVTYNTSYDYCVTQIGGAWNHCYTGGSANFPGQTMQIKNRPVNFSFPTVAGDSADFLFTHFIKEGINGDDHRKNDTIYFEQKFYDYYAYDDGVAEAGYGLTPANSMLAYKFTLNKPDTLRAVKIFFNQTLNNASKQFFKLTLWDDAGGHPGNVIWHSLSIKPQYEDSLNKFYNYRLDTARALSGTFYVGWKQMTDDFLNIGFDRNNDEHSKIFFNTGTGWQNSMYSGALMIRPVFGKPLPLVAGISEMAQTKGEIKAYPNPSSGNNITLVLPAEANKDVSKLRIHLFDMLGKEVCNYPYRNNIDVSQLQNGIYLLSVTSETARQSYFTRLSIVK